MTLSVAPPRGFGVRHLLAWTALSALAMVVSRQAFARGLDSSSPLAVVYASLQWTLQISAAAVAAGGQLMVAGCLAIRCYKGERWRLQPGQWLALMGTARWIQSVVMLVCRETLISFHHPRLLPSVAVVAPWIFAAWSGLLALRAREPLPWRLAYGMVAMGAVTTFGLSVLLRLFGVGPAVGFSTIWNPISMIYLGASVLNIGVLVAAMWSDVRKSHRRHWTHWIGAATFLLGSAVNLLADLWFAVSPPVLTGSGS